MTFNRKSIQKLIYGVLLLVVVLSPFILSAHEVYVLPKGVVEEGMHDESVNPLLALQDVGNLKTTIIISICVGIALVINFLFQHSRTGRRLSKKWEYLENWGQVIIRITVAASFLYSALGFTFLGPELSIMNFPLWQVIQPALIILSIFIFFGFFTEYAAILSLIIFSISVYVYHLYMFTYINYLGEFLALFLFGSRFFSLDGLFFGRRSWFERPKKYESLIIRVCYGFGLFYAAINIKFLHAILTLDVVNDYHLTQFHLLFPHDPLLVVLGAGLSEIAIGLFIMFGFELRLTVLISLFYITLSLFFFRELVWPHYILYGISLYLLFSPSRYSLDNWFDKKIKAFQEH